MAIEWTDERIETLKTMLEQGKSARDIAEKLGGGVSRNAVIGKAHRLGLSSRNKVVKQKPSPLKKDVTNTRTDKLCQWPIGDPGTPEFKFCYGDALPGRPYCEDHCNVAYRRNIDG